MIATENRPCICSTGDKRFFRFDQCQACGGGGIRSRSREKIIDHNNQARQPTWQEYLTFDGAHCKNIYRNLADSWNCPGCGRTKYEILRWTTLFPKIPAARTPGWAGGYHKHHDHSGDRYMWTEKPPGFTSRFEPTIICEQCNSADATVKRKLKLPSGFSFTPFEISQFVTAHPHGKHLIDYDRAQSIYYGVNQISRPFA